MLNLSWTSAEVKIFPLAHRPNAAAGETSAQLRFLPRIIDVIYLRRTAEAYRCSGEKKGTSRGCPLSTSERKVCFAWRRFSIFFFLSSVRRQCRLVDHDLVYLIRYVNTGTRTRCSRSRASAVRRTILALERTDVDWYIGTIFDTQWGGSFESCFISQFYKLHFFTTNRN